MIENKTKLVTCAFPYANGPIHIGHMLEHIQADIWVRYQRMRNKKVYFICADDAHGTPVMLKARQLGINLKEMIFNINKDHKKDFFDFLISYDYYDSTHTLENKEISEEIYFILKKKKLIKSKIIFQFYDFNKKMFLPDRFIKGGCPKCLSPDQYGDNCDFCGAIYNSSDLINPYSTISGTYIKLKKTKHFFFDLPKFTKMLKIWIRSGVLTKEIINKIEEWFSVGLQEWDISRDKPYFGFNIPGYSDKYFYVWLDASIGYISTFKNYCKYKKSINFFDFWKKNSNTSLYHFIGKDIVYFHSLFWPALLESIGYRKPTRIFVHGYVTVNGLKMSKSKGTFITVRSYLKLLKPDCLRYYYATKLSSKINDINFTLEDFVNTVNKEIVNKIVNLASRSAMFINNKFNNLLSSRVSDKNIYKIFVDSSEEISFWFSSLEYNKITKKIIFLADLANRYIEKNKPWVLVKKNKFKNDLHDISSMGINLFRILIIYLKPIVPDLANKSECFLKTIFHWEDIYTPLINHEISRFQTLFKRIDIKKINSLIIS